MSAYDMFKCIFLVYFANCSKLLHCNFTDPKHRPGWKSLMVTCAALVYLSMCFYTIYAYEWEVKFKAMSIVGIGAQVIIFIKARSIN